MAPPPPCLESPALACPAPLFCRFVVLGSKGNHYTVTLKDDRHTCGCLDYRAWLLLARGRLACGARLRPGQADPPPPALVHHPALVQGRVLRKNQPGTEGNRSVWAKLLCAGSSAISGMRLVHAPTHAGFRRHHCKHIMLVLSQLGIEEQPQEVGLAPNQALAREVWVTDGGQPPERGNPSSRNVHWMVHRPMQRHAPTLQWRSAVNAKMDELLEQKREREAVEARELPVPRAAAEQVALNFV